MTRTTASMAATAQVRGSQSSRSMRQLTTAESAGFKSPSAARQTQRQTKQWQWQRQWQPTATALAAQSSGHGTMHTAALSSAAATAPQSAPTAVGASSHSDIAHVDRADPAFFDADPFRLNEKGQTEWTSTSKRPRIVVLGTGWGSVSFLKGLKINNYEIVIVSPRNYFLFTPLLPSAATGTLEIGSLTEPIRQILLKRHKTGQNQYVEAKAMGLDRDSRKVQCVDANGREFVIGYDHLIVGVGADNNTFNTPGVEKHAFILKEAKHARQIRAKILSHFERAASPTTSIEEKKLLLQFVVVGGGPTGVEFAGELHDFLKSDLKRQFPSLMPLVRVRLLQSLEHILNTYDARISKYAADKFKELNIEIITNAHVQAIGKDSITFLDKKSGLTRVIPFGICLWSTGIQMNEFTRTMAAQIAGQESNRAIVTDDKLRMLLSIPRLDRVPKRIMDQAEHEISGDKTASGPTPVPAEEALRDLSVDPRIYVLGDCATTYVPKLAPRMQPIFEAADHDRDGYLSYNELRALCTTLSDKFPVMSAQMSLILGQYDAVDMRRPGGGVSLDEFEALLAEADKGIRVYPATAQVASQQGDFLAKRFNQYAAQQKKAGKMSDRPDESGATPAPAGEPRLSHPPVDLGAAGRPFRYRYMGSLAYIGGDTAAIDLGEAGAYTGWTAFWLWKSIYLSKAVSLRTRLNLAFDWFKTFFFGRDTSEP